MNPIGGYFELELRDGEEYHREALRLNSGRNAFEYILHTMRATRVYLPYYSCDALTEPIEKLHLKYTFYHVDEQLEPVFNFDLIKEDEAFLYINYFGLKDSCVRSLTKTCKNLIIDNTQSFYSNPRIGIPTFCSCRKFFGVTDGAYLYSDISLDRVLSVDHSIDKFGHLIKRIDDSAEAGYRDFKDTEVSICNQSMRVMSKLTQRILRSIDYDIVADVRRENYDYLHRVLGETNKLKFLREEDSVPMVYPYWTDKEGLREYLIEKKIFVAQYWPNVLEWCNSFDLEVGLTKNVIPIPIDQRYSFLDMSYIVKQIFEFK